MELPIRIGMRIHEMGIQFDHLQATNDSGVEVLMLQLSTDAAISLMFTLQKELSAWLGSVDVFKELQ